MSSLLLFSAILVLVGLSSDAALTATSPQTLEGYTFEQYLKDFHKKYSASEYIRREALFKKSLADVRAHNMARKHMYTMAINHMSDWSEVELKQINGAKPRMAANRQMSSIRSTHEKSSIKAPESLDYRKSFPPILTAVKDQGNCGSCWAHSATEAMETHYAMKTGKLFVMSQQQVSACTPNPRQCGGTGGCGGAVEALAFEYVHEVGGITEEWMYPYTQYYGDTGKCNNDTFNVATVKSYVEIPTNDHEALFDALVTKGPIAVGVDASQWSGYGSGIFDKCTYQNNATAVNHAVQLVGYGHDEKLNADYWIIRNSWSPGWGEAGYIRLLREKTPSCGWDVKAHDGSACIGDPDVVWICGMCGIYYKNTYPIME